MDHDLRNANGMRVRFLAYGGIITHVEVPDRGGRIGNVALNLPTPADYEARNGDYYLGAIIGRYAGRIAGAAFEIDGNAFQLEANDGSNSLHGGKGFHTKVWQIEPLDESAARLKYSSPDGEQGFPGRLDVAVTYRLLPDNALRIDYQARTSAPTMLNLTNHSYFNLAGGGSVLDHRLRIFAGRMAAITEAGIPTGEFPLVAGTAFDFSRERVIGQGYDNSWLIDRDRSGVLVLAARLCDPGSGRVLEVLTTEPTLHVYTADHFPEHHPGIALETQHLPDSPNRPLFPSTLLRPGETYRSTTIFRFSVAP